MFGREDLLKTAFCQATGFSQTQNSPSQSHKGTKTVATNSAVALPVATNSMLSSPYKLSCFRDSKQVVVKHLPMPKLNCPHFSSPMLKTFVPKTSQSKRQMVWTCLDTPCPETACSCGCSQTVESCCKSAATAQVPGAW